MKACHRTILDRFFRQLKDHSSILLLDYDGTLAPFHINPSKAYAYPGVLEMIEEIQRFHTTRVIIISGRALDSLLPLISLSPLPELWGSHGAERLTTKGRTEASLSTSQQQGLKLALDKIQKENLFLEKKPTSITAHWRGKSAEEQKRLWNTIQNQWLPISLHHDLELHPFDGGLELRACNISKATAIQTICQDISQNTVIAYLGDDRTDEDAFAALGNRALKILVRPEPRETLADIHLIPPHELLWFLMQWKEHLTLKNGSL